MATTLAQPTFALGEYCEKLLSAWSCDTPERLISLYAKDSVFVDPRHTEGLRGHQEILPYFLKLHEEQSGWEWYEEETFQHDRGFTLKWKAFVPANERMHTLYGMALVELEDGLIVRHELYYDRCLLEKLRQ